MKKNFVCCLVLLSGLYLANIGFAAGATPVTHQFAPNTPAKADEVNANFQELADRIAMKLPALPPQLTTHIPALGTRPPLRHLSMKSAWSPLRSLV